MPTNEEHRKAIEHPQARIVELEVENDRLRAELAEVHALSIERAEERNRLRTAAKAAEYRLWEYHNETGHDSLERLELTKVLDHTANQRITRGSA